MPIPTNRQDLVSQLSLAFEKLAAELDFGEENLTSDCFASLHCVDDWTVKDVLAIRRWWTEQVVRWILAGRAGQHPVTPKHGYKWTETPRLNAEIVAASRKHSWRQVNGGLRRGYQRVREVIDELDDPQLLQRGVFAWAEKWPVSRWISINTTRQYTTARMLIRKARKNAA